MFQSGLLPAYLLAIGFDALAVGIMETATLLGVSNNDARGG